MYDKLFTTACGMFNILHIIVIVLFFCALSLLLYVSRNMTKEQVTNLLRWVACLITVLEIIKIAVRIHGNEGPDSWVPLYYCSLFIFAVWFSISPWKGLQTAGFAYMTMGGIPASIFFVFYPSTALGMYPLFHLSTLHSLVYHLVMCYCGILVLRKEVYVPGMRDLIPYATLVLTACVLAVFVNTWMGTNCMFLEHPFGLPFLDVIREVSKPAYMLIVALAQGVGLYSVCCGIYRWVLKSKTRV